MNMFFYGLDFVPFYLGVTIVHLKCKAKIITKLYITKGFHVAHDYTLCSPFY